MPRFAKTLTPLILAAAFLIPSALAESAAAKTTDNLRLRKEPSLSAEVLDISKNGDSVSVTDTNPIVNSDATWYAVIYKGKAGYMSAEFLKLLNNDISVSEKGYINEPYVRFRVQPNTNCDTIQILAGGTSVEITGTKDGWYAVRHGGKDGYVRCDLISLGDAPTSAAANLGTLDANDAQRGLVESALTHLGKPYIYGNEGPNSFDCSGFTSYVYKQYGYTINRTALDQYRLTGRAVESKANLLPGDLVFFYTTSRTTVSHVGLYIGDGKFVHSSSGKNSKCVVISPINEGYYNERYAGAKRVL